MLWLLLTLKAIL